MAVTRSWSVPGQAPAVVAIGESVAPRSELVWLVCASLFVAAGLAMVYASRVMNFPGAGQLVNLNTVTGPEELLPLLESFPDRTERVAVAQRT
ncbi:MAG TPA: hypothetical protein VGH38_11930, partial [Bryobacteraceae bacterium]